jgi:hypothetical protein
METLTSEQLDAKLKKFITDPDWVYVEELFITFVEGLIDLNSIPEGLNNDQVASEVRGRKILANRLAQFLRETNVIKEKNISRLIVPGKPSFK